MNSVLKKFLLVGKALGESMVPGVAAVETAIQILASKDATNQQKQAAVVNAAINGLQAAEFLSNKDLLNDPDFVQAANALNDAYVKLLRVIERHDVQNPT